jgi:hypothetical protein
MSALRDFQENLAVKPYCSHDLQSLIIRSRNKAANFPYIQPNHAQKITWLVFDVDRGHQSALSYEDADLPEPNIITKNPANGNCHLFYRLAQPVWTHAAAGTKAQSYYKAIKTGLTKQIKADPNYSGLMSKNPLSDEWQTFEIHSGKFALIDLADRAELQWQSEANAMEKEAEAANSILGRNCSLFDTLRFFSYAKVSEYRELGISRCYDMWLKAVESEAAAINKNFNTALPYSEVRATAKSVAKWTWSNYKPTEQKRRGIMGYGETRHTNPEAPMLTEEEIKRRQSKAAELTNKHRKENTELQIKQAIERLEANGEKVTKAKVAKMTGLHRNAISRNYAHFFPEKMHTTVAIR